MKIVYRPHLEMRIKERQFPYNYPKRIYNEAKLQFFDTKTSHNIAVAKLKYAGKLRNLAITYDIIDKRIEIITIHPISQEEIEKRINTKRWQIKN